MATFEKRRNSLGQLTSIRVKVRRVGLPHLSQSFPVDASKGITERMAEKAAQQWVKEAEQNLAAPQIRPGSPRQGENRGLIAKAWAAAIAAPVRPSASFEELLGTSRPLPRGASDNLLGAPMDASSRMLLALALECGLLGEELAALRWQHIHLDSSWLDVPGAGGVVLRQAPLTPVLVSSLLAWRGRKYGPLFRQTPLELEVALERLMPGLPTTGSIRLEAAYRMAERGLTVAEIARYLGVGSLSAIAGISGTTPALHA